MSSLSESVIRASCGKRVLDRAEELIEWPALSDLYVCGEDPSLELFGQCIGSEGQRYAVRVRIQNGAVGESSCSCLYDKGGPCKHRVALMLAFARQGKKFKFHEFPSLVEMIASCSPDTLRDLMVAMVRRAPNLLPLLAASRGGDDEEPVSETLRRALSGRTATDGAPVLERVFGEASQLEAKSEWFQAGELYSAAIDALVDAAAGFEQFYEWELERSDGYDDEEGDFGDEWARMAVEGLGRALEVETLAPEARHKWLHKLWASERVARDYEYFSLPDTVRDLLIRFSSTELWADIEADLRAGLKSNPQRPRFSAQIYTGWDDEALDVPAHDDWDRERTLKFLLDGLRSHGRANEADGLIATVGTTAQKFDLKLRNRDFVGAKQLAMQEYAGTVARHRLLDCGTKLEEAGAPELALELVLGTRKDSTSQNGFSPSHSDSVWEAWLCDFYLRHNRPQEARVEAVRLFARTPDATQFARLKSAVDMLGTWSEQRDAIEREVRSHAGTSWGGKSRENEVALRLALQEGEAKRIYTQFGQFPKSERHGFLEAVAEAIEKEMPSEALPLWRELAEWKIENRNQNSARQSYVSAAQSLLRAQALHDELDSMDEWDEYMTTLRGVYKSLRALHDELKKAGL